MFRGNTHRTQKGPIVIIKLSEPLKGQAHITQIIVTQQIQDHRQHKIIQMQGYLWPQEKLA